MPSLDIESARLTGSSRRTVDGVEVVFHVIEVSGADGEQWKVERRYTEFSGLRIGLTARHTAVGRLPFPRKGIFTATADRERELDQWLTDIFRAGVGVSSDPQLRAFLVPTEMESGDMESLLGSFAIPPTSPSEVASESPEKRRSASTIRTQGKIGELRERELAARSRAEEAEQELVNMRTVVGTLRAAVARTRESVQGIADKQRNELEQMHAVALSSSRLTDTQAAVATQWRMAFRVQALVAVVVAFILRLRGASGALSSFAPLAALCVVPAVAGLATTFLGSKGSEDTAPPPKPEVDASDALKRLGAIDFELSCATGAVRTVGNVGDKVQVWHEIQKPDGTWDLISAAAVIQSRLPDGRVEVVWEDGGDPYLISNAFIGPGGEKAARDAVAATRAGPGDKVVVWYEEENESGSSTVTSSTATIVKVLGDGSSVELDGVKGGADRFVVERKYLGPGGEVAVRMTMDQAQELGSPRRKATRLKPAVSNEIVPLNETARKALEVFARKGWRHEKTDKRGGVVVCNFDSQPVEWSPTKACKFSCEVKCSVRGFFDIVVKDAPAPVKQFDALLDHFEVLEEGSDRFAGHKLYTNFFSPVPRVVGRRDFVTLAQDALLTKEECKKYGIPITGEYPELDTRAIEQSQVNLDYGVYCVSNMSTEHPSRPPNNTFVRGHAHAQAYIIVGRGPDKMWLCEVQSLNPMGSIPAWAVDLGAVKVIERFVNLRNYLEREYKAKYLRKRK